MGLPDISYDIFAGTETIDTAAFTYCTPFQARRALNGQRTTGADRVCVAGSVALGGSATLLTFVAETGPTASGPWSPVGYLDSPTVSAGVALFPLAALRWKLTATGAHPSVSFSPDQAFVRIGVKADQAGASATLTAYLSQQGA